MCGLIALAAVVWAWIRMEERDRPAPVGGLAASAFWAVFGVLMALGTFSMLFIVLIPVGVAVLVLSKWFEPVRSWLVLAGLVTVPTAWMATGAIDAGAGGWVAAGVGVIVTGLVAVAFETRERRSPAPGR
jgi:hypothetical protein